jgi:hypothetical protein
LRRTQRRRVWQLNDLMRNLACLSWAQVKSPSKRRAPLSPGTTPRSLKLTHCINAYLD